MGEFLIGCDVGSQGIKTSLCSVDGVILAQAYKGYTISYPHPMWAEQSPDLWLEALVITVREVLNKSDVNPLAVMALGVDAQVDGVVPIDESGEPLREAIIWLDRRASLQCERLEKIIDPEEIFYITGVNLDPSHVAPKILWIKDNEPEVYRRTWKFLLPTSYVVYLLTGEAIIDYSNASSTMLFDVQKKIWSEKLLSAMDIPIETMCKILPATDIAGNLSQKIADLTGLSVKTPVTVGCGDEHAATIGAGVISPGYICDIGGTAEPVCTVSLKPVFDPSKLVETHCHCDPETWLIENPGFVSGANFRWFRDEFAHAEVETARLTGKDPYDLLSLEASKVQPGSDGLVFLPCMMGAMTPEWNPHARGVFYGLTLSHGREHVIRSILEASAYGLRDIVEQMEIMGLHSKEIRAIGGAARSFLWLQIKADVTGKAITIPEILETSSLGSALIAGVGSGAFVDLNSAIEKVVRISYRVEPDRQNRDVYDRTYKLYRKVYSNMREVFLSSNG